MALSLDGLYSNYDDIYGKSASTSRIDELQETLKNKDMKTSSEKELMDVCKEFESYFAEQVFKAMEKMVPENEESSNSDYMNMFGDILTQEYAKNATNQGEGLGLAKMLYEQMKRNYNIE